MLIFTGYACIFKPIFGNNNKKKDKPGGIKMSVRINISGEVLTAYLEGELDHHSAKDIREQIDNAIDRNAPSLLILDFRDLTFMDSSGIGLVMGRYRKMKEFKGEVHIANTSPQIYKVMKLSGLDRLARIDKGGNSSESAKRA